jgi:Flp pilus assembly pilin Flp
MRERPQRDDTLAVKTQQRTSRRNRSEEGAGLVEYVLLVGLILIVCVISVDFLGQTSRSRVESSGSALEAPLGP